MNEKKRDNLSYYEVYNQRGDLVAEGDKHMIAEQLGLNVKHVARSAKIGTMNRDGVPIYEAYDSEGNLVSTGTSKQVGEAIGLTPNRISKVASEKKTVKGYEIVKVATIRKVFDCYHKGKFVCSGTYDEIAERTGFNREYVKAASYAATHKRAAKTRESMMLLLFEHDDTKLEWI